jgi:hypothetical protein
VSRALLALVPAQRGLLPDPLEYDLTIREVGTFAVWVGADGAEAREIDAPRPRSVAAFHLAADVDALTQALAGVDKRLGRWIGSLRVRGRRRAAETLRRALAGADLSLAAAARNGADLDPDVVFRAFAHAIDPDWTRGHRFTVAQEIVGDPPRRWHVVIRDGAPVVVERSPSGGAPDAIVSMSRDAFRRLLRREPAAPGDRPQVRGDRAAVATLKAWTDRAQGG